MAQANIKAVITADDRASATLGGFGNNVDALGSKITGALKVAGVAAFAAVAAGIVGATKASWDQVDAVQQATIALNAYEKDGSKVNRVLSDLVKYARSDLGVLFNRKDLFQSAQSLKIYGDNTESLTDHVKILSRSVGLGLSTWEGLNNVIGRVGSTGRLYADDLQYLQNAGFKLDSSLSGSTQTFETLFAALEKGIPADALAGQAETIQGKFIRLETAFRGVGDAILGVNQDTGKFIEGGLGDRLVETMDSLRNVLADPNFKKTLSDITNGILAVSDAISNWLVKAWQYLKPVIDDTVNAIKVAWAWFAQNLLPIFQQLWAFITVQLKQAWDSIVASVKQISDQLEPFISKGDQLKIILGLLLLPLALTVAAIVAFIAIVSVVVAIIATLINWISQAINIYYQLSGAVSNAMGSFVNSVVGGIRSAIAWFQALPGNILSAIGNLGSLLFNAGKSIVEGLVNGIKSAAGAAADAAKGVADSAVKAAKNLLGIHSPSTVFAGIGENIGAGMIQGIESTMPSVANAMNSLTPSNSSYQAQSVGTVVNQSIPTPNITIQVGAFMGTQTDARKLAKMVFDSYQEIQAMGGVA